MRALTRSSCVNVTAGAERSRTSGRPALSGAVYRAADDERLLMGVSSGLLAAVHAHSEAARRKRTRTGLGCDIVSFGWDGMNEGVPYI
jgi:hypothetical protein